MKNGYRVIVHKSAGYFQLVRVKFPQYTGQKQLFNVKDFV